jgi:TRAP-type C4-dicarboxylate transport system permease small subunit
VSGAEPADSTGAGAQQRGELPRNRAVVWLDRLVKTLLALALIVVLVFTVGQVLDRYLIKSTFDAHDQYARIGLVWLTFIGIAVGIRDRVNVRIELIHHLAAPAVRRWVSILLDLVTLAVAILLAIVGVRLLEVGSFQVIMGTPLNYDAMYAALLAGMALLALYLLLRFVDLFSGGRTRLDSSPVQSDDHRE